MVTDRRLDEWGARLAESLNGLLDDLDAIEDFAPVAEHLSWKMAGACYGSFLPEFWPGNYSGEYRRQIALAKSVCAGCVVRAECLTYALETEQPFGVWGGLTAIERRRLRNTGEA